MNAPLHEHDCNTCAFLGNHEGSDLYVCRNEPHTYDGHMTDVVRGQLSRDMENSVTIPRQVQKPYVEQ